MNNTNGEATQKRKLIQERIKTRKRANVDPVNTIMSAIGSLEQVGNQLAQQRDDTRVPVSAELMEQLVAMAKAGVTIRSYVERAIRLTLVVDGEKGGAV